MIVAYGPRICSDPGSSSGGFVEAVQACAEADSQQGGAPFHHPSLDSVVGTIQPGVNGRVSS